MVGSGWVSSTPDSTRSRRVPVNEAIANSTSDDIFGGRIRCRTPNSVALSSTPIHRSSVASFLFLREHTRATESQRGPRILAFAPLHLSPSSLHSIFYFFVSSSLSPAFSRSQHLPPRRQAVRAAWATGNAGTAHATTPPPSSRLSEWQQQQQQQPRRVNSTTGRLQRLRQQLCNERTPAETFEKQPPCAGLEGPGAR